MMNELISQKSNELFPWSNYFPTKILDLRDNQEPFCGPLSLIVSSLNFLHSLVLCSPSGAQVSVENVFPIIWWKIMIIYYNIFGNTSLYILITLSFIQNRISQNLQKKYFMEMVHSEVIWPIFLLWRSKIDEVVPKFTPNAFFWVFLYCFSWIFQVGSDQDKKIKVFEIKFSIKEIWYN